MTHTSVTMPNDILLGEVRNLIREGRSVIIMTKGLSMLPFIVGKKDSVLLEGTEEVKPGDIALAEISEGKYVLHRVIAVDGGTVTLRGDGNLRGVERCPFAGIVGVVKEIRHADGSSTNPGSASQMRRWRRWQRLPYIVRRYWLAFYRRLKHITI